MKMQYGTIPGVGKPVSRLAHGAMMLRDDDLDWTFAHLDMIYELGCNTFDTAHVYGNADSLLGKWIRARGLQDKVVIVAKCSHPNAVRRRVTPFDIASDLHDTLARMQLDSVDLLLLHRDDPSVPVGPIVEAFNEHVAGGRIRAFGGSNWTHQRIAEANAYAEAHGLAPFAVSSPNFSLAEMVESPWGDDYIAISGPREAEAREWYAEQGMALLPWSSLARGFFTGRITRENYREALRPEDRSSIHTYCHEVNFRRLDRAEILAKEKGLTVAQVALAFVLNHAPRLHLFPLVGTYSREEFERCVQTLDVKLAPEEMAWLDLQADER